MNNKLNINTELDFDELRSRLALIRLPGIGPIRFYKIIEQLGSATRIFTQDLNTLVIRKLPVNTHQAIKNPPWAEVDADLEWAQQQDHHIVINHGHAYPKLLSQLPDAPPVLYIRGNVQLLNQPQIAIVGSRNPSHNGREDAFQFAHHLAQSGLTITSGLAEGIDAASHQGALAGNGHTIAVNGTGLNVVYPRKHLKLAAEILETGGTLVSEFPPDTPISRENFPRRNRIISGLSFGTLVVEATKGSGSLITAKYAAEQGREVFAIPGSIHNPMAKGCHILIKEGAKLVESASDIFEEFRHILSDQEKNFSRLPATPVKRPALSELEMKIYECVGYEQTSIDQVVERSGNAVETVSSILLVLDLQGIIVSHLGGQYSRVVREDVCHERECV